MPMEQRLTAVLAADVVGYSKLMGTDQTATLAALRVLRSEIFNPCVAGHGGQTVKSMGDGWIVTFTSVSDAATCAIDIQEKTLQASTLQLRIGIHLGDIVQEDEDLFGDGVNIASRLEAAASPGDVLISDVVFHSLNGPLATNFHQTLPLKLKNIEREFTAYSWNDGPIASAADSTTADDQNPDDESEKDEEITLCFVGMTLKGGDEESQMLCEGVDEAVRSRIARGLNRVLTGHLLENADRIFIASSGGFTQSRVSVLCDYDTSARRQGGTGMAIKLNAITGRPFLEVLLAPGVANGVVFDLTPIRYEFLARVAAGALPASFSRFA